MTFPWSLIYCNHIRLFSEFTSHKELPFSVQQTYITYMFKVDDKNSGTFNEPTVFSDKQYHSNFIILVWSFRDSRLSIFSHHFGNIEVAIRLNHGVIPLNLQSVFFCSWIKS